MALYNVVLMLDLMTIHSWPLADRYCSGYWHLAIMLHLDDDVLAACRIKSQAGKITDSCSSGLFFPSNLSVITKFSNCDFLKTWPKNSACLVLIVIKIDCLNKFFKQLIDQIFLNKVPFTSTMHSGMTCIKSYTGCIWTAWTVRVEINIPMKEEKHILHRNLAIQLHDDFIIGERISLQNLLQVVVKAL